MSHQKELLEQLFPGVIAHLESLDGVTDIKFHQKPPVSESVLDAWERSNAVKLPDDLRAILNVSNGFELCWFVKFGNFAPIKIGSLSLSSLDDFIVNMDSFNDKIEAYTISCDIETCHYGQACIILPPTSEPQIWFKPFKAESFMVAKSFSSYFRLMTSFLGIIGWQM